VWLQVVLQNLSLLPKASEGGELVIMPVVEVEQRPLPLVSEEQCYHYGEVVQALEAGQVNWSVRW
jgi:hypothetical protein